MRSQTSAFEDYVLGLLAVSERLPLPLAFMLGTHCERVEGNAAFRRLTGVSTAALKRSAAEDREVVEAGVSAWPLRGADGRVLGSVGVFYDAHASLESAHGYRLIAEAMPQCAWLGAPDGRTLYVNKRWLDYTGRSAPEQPTTIWQADLHPEDTQRLEAERQRGVANAQPFEAECRCRGKDGKYRWFLFRAIPVRDDADAIVMWLGTATNIEKQKRAEWQQTFFALASDVLGSTLDVATTLERIGRLAIASLGTWCQIDIPDEEGRLRVATVAHQEPHKEALLAQLLNKHVYNDAAQLGPPAVLRTFEPQLLNSVDRDAVAYVVPDPAYRAIYQSAGYSSGLMVPLRIRDRVLGVLGIASDDPTRLYTDTDVSTAMELGRRGAIALENAQSFAREHHVATTLQRALLPSSLPHTDAVRFSSAYCAAPSEQGEAVGGDWYDAFALEGGRIALSIGDVAGHGLDAAVTMGVVRQSIRAAALDLHIPKEVLVRANRVMQLEPRYPMITAIFAIYNTHTREFSYSAAGHPAPICVDAAGTVTMLNGTGAPLGDAFDEALLAQATITLPPGAAVVFFTDGLLEYRRDLLLAHERLCSAIAARSFLECENPAQAIIDAVLDAPQCDDIAVLVLHV